MRRKNDFCSVGINSQFVFGGGKFLLLFYGMFFAFWPGYLCASSLRLRVSPVFRSSQRVKYRGKSCAARINCSDFLADFEEEPLADLGYGDRLFADGYVYQDPGTGKPETLLPDSTWNWGYHNASQYDEESQTLTFKKPFQDPRKEFERIAGNSGNERESDRVNEHYALELAVEIPLENVFLSLDSLSFGWQWIPFWRERGKFNTFQEAYLINDNLWSGDELYHYSTYGAELPPPGHAGSYEGPFDDPPLPGTLIANRPSSVQRIYSGSGQRLSSEAVRFRNQVRFQLDCQQQEFWLGPVFRWFPLPWLSCSVSPRGNLLYSDMELKRQEKLWQFSDDGKRQLRGSWLHKKAGRRLLLGTSICCALESEWENGLFAGLSLSTSWYPENLELRAGPGRVSLRPGTLCAGAIFGYRF